MNDIEMIDDIENTLSVSESFLNNEDELNNKRVIYDNFISEGFFSNAINAIKKFFKSIIKFFISIWKAIVNFFKNIWKKAIEIIRKIFGNDSSKEKASSPITTAFTESLEVKVTQVDNVDDLKNKYLKAMQKLNNEINIRSKQNIQYMKDMEKYSIKVVNESMEEYLEERFIINTKTQNFHDEITNSSLDSYYRSLGASDSDINSLKLTYSNKVYYKNSIGSTAYEKHMNAIPKTLLEKLIKLEQGTVEEYNQILYKMASTIMTYESTLAYRREIFSQIEDLVEGSVDLNEVLRYLRNYNISSIAYNEWMNYLKGKKADEKEIKIVISEVFFPELSEKYLGSDFEKRRSKIQQWAHLKLNHNKLIINSLKNMIVLNQTIFGLTNYEIFKELSELQNGNISDKIKDLLNDIIRSKKFLKYPGVLDLSSIKLEDLNKNIMIRSKHKNLATICVSDDLAVYINGDKIINKKDRESIVTFTVVNNPIITDQAIDFILNWDLVVFCHGGSYNILKNADEKFLKTNYPKVYDSMVQMDKDKDKIYKYSTNKAYLYNKGEYNNQADSYANDTWIFANPVPAPNGKKFLIVEEFLDEIFKIDPQHKKYKRINILSCNPANIVLNERFNVPGVIIKFSASSLVL